VPAVREEGAAGHEGHAGFHRARQQRRGAAHQGAGAGEIAAMERAAERTKK
jgi:hypothetical protein